MHELARGYLIWTAIRLNPLSSASYLSVAGREFEIRVVHPLHYLTWEVTRALHGGQAHVIGNYSNHVRSEVCSDWCDLAATNEFKHVHNHVYYCSSNLPQHNIDMTPREACDIA